jgi:hypothetical protein
MFESGTGENVARRFIAFLEKTKPTASAVPPIAATLHTLTLNTRDESAVGIMLFAPRCSECGYLDAEQLPLPQGED